MSVPRDVETSSTTGCSHSGALPAIAIRGCALLVSGLRIASVCHRQCGLTRNALCPLGFSVSFIRICAWRYSACAASCESVDHSSLPGGRGEEMADGSGCSQRTSSKVVFCSRKPSSATCSIRGSTSSMFSTAASVRTTKGCASSATSKERISRRSSNSNLSRRYTRLRRRCRRARNHWAAAKVITRG